MWDWIRREGHAMVVAAPDQRSSKPSVSHAITLLRKPLASCDGRGRDSGTKGGIESTSLHANFNSFSMRLGRRQPQIFLWPWFTSMVVASAPSRVRQARNTGHVSSCSAGTPCHLNTVIGYYFFSNRPRCCLTHKRYGNRTVTCLNQ